MNVQEAFQALDALNEDTFSISDDGIEKLDDLLKDNDTIDTIDIIDPDAETEDELQDSYVGKVILDCLVCHSKLYKDENEVVLNEEEDLANVGEECPYCYTSDGFKVIGKVCEFNKHSDEEEPEDDEEELEIDEEEVKESETDEEDKKEESLKEAVDLVKTKGTIANLLSSEMEQLSSITDVDELKQKVVDLIKKSDVSPAGKKKALTTILSKKNTNALLATLATWMTGDKAISSKAKNKKDEQLEEDYNKDLIIDDKDYIFDEDSGILKVNKNSFNKFHKDNYVNIQFLDDNDDKVCSFKMIKETPDHIYMEYLGEPIEEKLQEDIQNLSLDTDDTHMEMTSTEEGKVTITTEPIEEKSEEEEVIKPLDDETKEKIETNTSETEEEDEVDVDLEYFDDESFDNLGESYLKAVYENVKSYKTTSVQEQGNKLIVEGVITFNSNNQKKTKFLFEAKDITKDGTIRFIGENLNITKGKKAFCIKGKENKGNFITESFNYNYKAKNNKGQSSRVYGTLYN